MNEGVLLVVSAALVITGSTTCIKPTGEAEKLSL
jgi:hypothetical protein